MYETPFSIIFPLINIFSFIANGTFPSFMSFASFPFTFHFSNYCIPPLLFQWGCIVIDWAIKMKNKYRTRRNLFTKKWLKSTLTLLIVWYLHFHCSLPLTRTWIINLKWIWGNNKHESMEGDVKWVLGRDK